ncbi:MAG: hypothetical protein ACQERN_08070, partial [Thermodesulfobacteriota bacterium]
ANAVLYDGIRPLGMGNAFTAVADDENAVFYNPAGLSMMSGFQLGVVNPLIEIADDSIDFADDAGDVDFDNTTEVADLLRNYTGKPQHVRVGLFPHLGLNIKDVGVMVGALGQGTVDVEINNPVWPQTRVDLIADYGPIAGAGFKLPAVENLHLGMSLKYIGRESLSEVYTPAEIAADDFDDQLDDDQNSGSAASVDFGAIYELSFIEAVDTKVGFSALNIPEMDMGDAVDIKSQYDIGVAVGKSFGFCDIVGAFDIHDITNNAIADSELSKRIHMGAEVQLPVLALRAGLNDGYLAGGATIDLKLFRFDVATYATEKGAYAGQKDERRYLAQVSFGW